MNLRNFSSCLLLAAVAVLAGCSQGNPLDDHADAGTPHDYAMWHQRESDRLTVPQSQALDTAIEQLKLKAQAGGAKGDAIDDAMRKEINGKTVREVLQLGYSWGLATLEEQRTYVDQFIKQNAELTTKPGDTASADYLAERRDEQTSRRRQLDQQISDLEDQMKSLGLAVVPAKLPPNAGKIPDQPQPSATPSGHP
ncbi:MAG TPA: hypothetical protein VHE61_18155 [Opitutaceae bacterium]|nr:hypothetical protein [Opitutaceae bacterium]